MNPANLQSLDEGSLTSTRLHESPFAVLGATARDSSRRIIELAEERSLVLDQVVCQKARSELTNARTRLGVEVAWLPGLSPRKVAEMLDRLSRDPMVLREESGLPRLAHLNLLAAALEAIDTEHDIDDLAAFVRQIAVMAEEVDLDEVLRDITADRAVSGFPGSPTVDQVEAEWTGRRRYYCSAIKGALDTLPTSALVEAMTEIVDDLTQGGETHAPALIDELVDSYEVDAQGFLQAEAETINALIKATRDAALTGERAVGAFVERIDLVTRNWDRIAQPIQLSAKSRHIHHQASRDLAYAIRELALFLFNEHGMLDQSQRLTTLMQELFLELPVVAERAEADMSALAEIAVQREQAAERSAEWAREVTYQTVYGLIFKHSLSISPDGVTWDNYHFPLESITHVRWGGVRQSINGIPTGTSYTIAIGDEGREVVIELDKEHVYSTFVDKLWKAVGVRLFVEMLNSLRAGNVLTFGDASVRDDGVTLPKRKFLSANEEVWCDWSEVSAWSHSGALYIGSRHHKKVVAALSYIHTPNAHVLERTIRLALGKQGIYRLSDLLRE